ncbi:MAG: 4Fe-4S ferredoxin [Candidatus Thorarchaeota archaeon]|nr:MAG: 4Fe-4S ferredoxin [Candidatus Thorarchaeota archaeon]
MVNVPDPELQIDTLMSTNVGDPRIREKGRLLLVGSCMPGRYPDIVREFKDRNGGFFAVQVCLEEIHINQAGFKIGSIISYSDVRTVTVLTVDGSPHCVQLHFVIEDIKRHFQPGVHVEHFVVEKGRVHKISAKAVKQARHLSKIQSMIGS